MAGPGRVAEVTRHCAVVTAPHVKNPPAVHELADRGFIEHGLRELARNAQDLVPPPRCLHGAYWKGCPLCPRAEDENGAGVAEILSLSPEDSTTRHGQA